MTRTFGSPRKPVSSPSPHGGEQERWLESQRWTLVEEDGVYTLNLITPTFGGGGLVVRLTVVDEP